MNRRNFFRTLMVATGSFLFWDYPTIEIMDDFELIQFWYVDKPLKGYEIKN
jgi:hypothetical protein